MNSTSMVHTSKYEKISTTNVRQDSRSQSLPQDLDDSIQKDNAISENLDTHGLLLAKKECLTIVSQDSWFNTWPERCDKNKLATTPDNLSLIVSNGQQKADDCDTNMTNMNGKFTLDEALQNISLAYSPVTKQLHFVEHKSLNHENLEETDNNKKALVDLTDAKHIDLQDTSELSNNFIIGKSLGHRRNEPGSYSSTISTLSDPSPSGSLLESDDRSSTSGCESGATQQRKSFSTFFNKNVFSWKSAITSPSSTTSVWKIFGKTSDTASSSPQHSVVSSSALIPNMRPSNLPAKSEEEELRHQEEYKAMLAAAKRKEALYSVAKQKHQKMQLQLEEQQAQSTKHFTRNVLTNWDKTYNTRKTRDLWWLGLPSSVRGRVWRFAIGNDLNLTQQLYEICLSRAQSRLNNLDPTRSESENDQESSMDVIQLDISRTFPSLCIFQEGGPYSEVLHSLLAAYVCYRPDVGYVQGMSYIAAILILNMEEIDAFVCFANLLNRPLHVSAFTLNQIQMQAYYNAYNEIFNYNLPKLYNHFECSGLTPDLYLLDWIYTIFAKAMPLDIACRIWDLFLRDGDEFIFRTALGILHLNQELLMEMDFLHGAQFLTRLPDDLPVDQLFKSIQTISTSIGKQTFNLVVEKCSNEIMSESQ